MSYQDFLDQIQEKNQYHCQLPTAPIQEFEKALKKSLNFVPESYLEFMKTVGAGRYFGGNLQIYDLRNGPLSVRRTGKMLSFVSFLSKLIGKPRKKYFPFGHEYHSSEYVFCFANGYGENVFLVTTMNGEVCGEVGPFSEWREAIDTYFDQADYRKFVPVDSEIKLLCESERKKFLVNLISFTNQPGDNFNDIEVEVEKLEASPLRHLTVEIIRLGTKRGDESNFARLDIAGLPVGKTKITHRVYKSFGGSFQDLICSWNPIIKDDPIEASAYKELQEFDSN